MNVINSGLTLILLLLLAEGKKFFCNSLPDFWIQHLHINWEPLTKSALEAHANVGTN